jgi:hypothetical protein
MPNAQPTSRPSAKPSLRPIGQPTSRPTTLPTPNGSSGKAWWYLVTGRVLLIADPSLSRHLDVSDLTEDVTYAFAFALTDDLSESDREQVTVLSFPIKGSVHIDSEEEEEELSVQRRLSLLDTLSMSLTAVSDVYDVEEREDFAVIRDSNGQMNTTIEYHVRAWCLSRKTAMEVSLAVSLID